MKYKRRISSSIVKRTCWCIFIIFICLYVFNIHRLFSQTYYRKEPVDLPLVTVHLDFKGAPPKLDYLISILPQLKKNGANALLMEYEDVFPYEGRIFNLSARNGYKRRELQEFLRVAVSSGFEIIPLVQTFGHMEFVLKLKEFQHLREVPKFLDSICPSNHRSISLIKEILKQIISFHNEITKLQYIHIGCDEVYNINICNRCTSRHVSNKEIFFRHIEAVASIVKKINPEHETKILIWDDMMKYNINWNQVRSYDNIQPVSWDYNTVKLPYASLYQYSKKFDGIWIASAFKGADGVTATLPNLDIRFQNHLNWMKSIQELRWGNDNSIYKFKGIILTGWSRYSHMDPLVELLPLALPSLVLSLITIQTFKDSTVIFNKGTDSIEKYEELIRHKFFNELNCAELAGNNFKDLLTCDFKGADLYKIVNELMDINQQVNDAFYSDDTGLASKYFYFKHCYINFQRPTITWVYNTVRNLSLIKHDLTRIMTKYYDKRVIDEYVDLKIQISKTRLGDFMEKIKMCSNITTWPRGPIT